MRIFLILWLGPLFLLGTWYGLAANDLNLGTHFFSREMHDLVFGLYGDVLGIDPALLPGMLARTLAFDCMLVVAVIAFKKRKAWWPQFSTKVMELVNTKLKPMWQRELREADQGIPAE